MIFLVYFVHRHLEFRLPELDSLLQMNQLDPTQCYDRSLVNLESPFMLLDLPSEEAAVQVCQRAILIKRILQLWGRGTTLEECAQATREYPEEIKSQYCSESISWAVFVEGFGLSIPMAAQETMRAQFRHLDFQGPVKCRNPDQMFWVYCEYEYFKHEVAFDQRTPLQVFMGREVCRSSRKLVGKNDLKKRKYLGPTSMDNELSLIMANMAQARAGRWVFDPFVGTGSILVACAQFGAFCSGTDIDIRVLRGKKGVSVYSNFHQYALPIPELIRSDNSLYGRHFRQQSLYDAIVCDPPYGIRAGARKSGSKRETVRAIPPEERRNHIPQTQVYPVEDVMRDLLRVAATTLRVGGRLCYLLPCTYDLQEEDLPSHPCLSLKHNSLERMTMKMGRRLITMEKVLEYDYSKEAEYEKEINVKIENTSAEDIPYANLKEKTKRKNTQAPPPPPLELK